MPAVKMREPPPPEYQVPNLTQYRLNMAERWWFALTPQHRAYLIDMFHAHEQAIEQIARIYFLTRW